MRIIKNYQNGGTLKIDFTEKIPICLREINFTEKIQMEEQFFFCLPIGTLEPVAK